ncbi:MGMT family protein [Thalassotalea sp. PS06]|uniref:MGMT family protein n=1 Tax=Thalassotalea sp. PS06 TaxID=2594005 RepID=UPI001163D1B0|nr:MGMT family protein [Thalassotalea sp. PS06]QDP01917.1 cysteine methyltransferase [Thalassotalea sp. PS06]
MPTINDNNLQRIWILVTLVPPGKVVSYGQLADLAGLPGRARLAGRALKLAPKAHNLPWHRVLNSQGKISLPKGSDGYQEQVKRLQEEGVVVLSGKVKLAEFQWQPDLGELLALPF